jgi:hypothetical protein
MCHHLSNLEHHHFKYQLFRRPGDVQVHFLGTATLSFTDGVEAQEGDVFEVEAAPFTLAVKESLAAGARAVDQRTVSLSGGCGLRLLKVHRERRSESE